MTSTAPSRGVSSPARVSRDHAGDTIPEALLGSPLLRWGGFGLYEGLLDQATLAGLLDEAYNAYPAASDQQCWEVNEDEGRGGTPRRQLLTAEGGPVQDALYGTISLHHFLSGQCGVPIVPSGNRGSYSYYARPGDFLDLHRDVDTCDVAMITVLHDSAPGRQGGALVLYPDRIHDRLAAVRASPQEGAHVVKVQPGHTAIMFGGLVPHWVCPVAENQVRIISVLCFRALLPD
ncbi:MAG: hypothetical protein ACRDK3_12610 [Actinomycetota bacterium]